MEKNIVTMKENNDNDINNILINKDKIILTNLIVLKRIDSHIENVLGTAGYVSIYSFQQEQKLWEKKGIEGSLFIVKRNIEPFYQFLVMNRLNTNNLIESITNNFQIQISEPYLLYRNNNGEINGIWFYNSNEREIICKIIQNLIDSFHSEIFKNSILSINNQKMESLLTNNDSMITKQQLKLLLMNLIQDEQFIDLVYQEYLKQFEKIS